VLDRKEAPDVDALQWVSERGVDGPSMKVSSLDDLTKSHTSEAWRGRALLNDPNCGWGFHLPVPVEKFVCGSLSPLLECSKPM